jgi:hypothetical protein
MTGHHSWRELRSARAAVRIQRRRQADPVRDARRQAHLTRMLRRVVDFIPRYRALTNGHGDVVGQQYLGHVAVYAR